MFILALLPFHIQCKKLRLYSHVKISDKDNYWLTLRHFSVQRENQKFNSTPGGIKMIIHVLDTNYPHLWLNFMAGYC